MKKTTTYTERFTIDFISKKIIGTQASFNKASKGTGEIYEELASKIARHLPLRESLPALSAWGFRLRPGLFLHLFGGYQLRLCSENPTRHHSTYKRQCHSAP